MIQGGDVAGIAIVLSESQVLCLRPVKVVLDIVAADPVHAVRRIHGLSPGPKRIDEAVVEEEDCVSRGGGNVNHGSSRDRVTRSMRALLDTVPHVDKGRLGLAGCDFGVSGAIEAVLVEFAGKTVIIHTTILEVEGGVGKGAALDTTIVTNTIATHRVVLEDGAVGHTVSSTIRFVPVRHRPGVATLVLQLLLMDMQIVSVPW